MASAAVDWQDVGLGRISEAGDQVKATCCRMRDVEVKEDRTDRETLETIVSFTARINEHSCRSLDVPSLLYAMLMAPALDQRGLCQYQECVSPDNGLDLCQ